MKYQYWLANIRGIGNHNIHRLLQAVDCAEELYFLKEEQIEKIPGISLRKVHALVESRKTWDLDAELMKLSEKGIDFWSEEMPHFPEALKTIADAPYAIYVKGRFNSINFLFTYVSFPGSTRQYVFIFAAGIWLL